MSDLSANVAVTKDDVIKAFKAARKAEGVLWMKRQQEAKVAFATMVAGARGFELETQVYLTALMSMEEPDATCFLVGTGRNAGVFIDKDTGEAVDFILNTGQPAEEDEPVEGIEEFEDVDFRDIEHEKE